MSETVVHQQCPGCFTDFRVIYVVDKCETKVPASEFIRSRLALPDAELRAELTKVFSLDEVAEEAAPEPPAALASQEHADAEDEHDEHHDAEDKP